MTTPSGELDATGGGACTKVPVDSSVCEGGVTVTNCDDVCLSRRSARPAGGGAFLNSRVFVSHVSVSVQEARG